ncbi:MAG: hypothetical protein ACRELA_12040 [Candidatus Rokuibacteriota bacterium]
MTRHRSELESAVVQVIQAGRASYPEGPNSRQAGTGVVLAVWREPVRTVIDRAERRPRKELDETARG